MSFISNFKNDQSQSTLYKSLSLTLNSNVKYLSSCILKLDIENFEKKSSIIVITDNNVILINDEFESIELLFEFSFIEYLIEESSNLNGLMFKLKNVYYKNIYHDAVYVSIPDRNTLISFIKCYYSTYFNFHNNIIKEIKIHSSQVITLKNNKCKVFTKKKIENFPPEKYKKIEISDYIFFYRENIIEVYEEEKSNENEINGNKNEDEEKNMNNEQDNQENEDENEENEENIDSYVNKYPLYFKFSKIISYSKESIQDKDDQENDNIDEVPVEKYDIYFNAQIYYSIINSISVNEISQQISPLSKLDVSLYDKIKLIINSKFEDAEYYFTTDSRYKKRFNINRDSSTWEGSRIELLVIKPIRCKLIFTLLRRKYIPPFFEFIDDILIWMKIDIPKELSINEFIDYCYNNDYYFDKEYEMILDSISSRYVQSYINIKNILISKWDSLDLTLDGYYFFKNNLNVFGEEVYLYGLQFVQFVIKHALNTKLYKIITNNETRNNYILNNISTHENEKIFKNIKEDSNYLKISSLMFSDNIDSNELLRKITYLKNIEYNIDNRVCKLIESKEKFRNKEDPTKNPLDSSFYEIFLKYEMLLNDILNKEGLIENKIICKFIILFS